MIATEATRLYLRPRRRLALHGIALMGVLCVATPSHAALAPVWEAGGQIISTGNGERKGLKVVPDQTGGAYFVWAERLTNKPWHIHVQHLLADGSLAENWVPKGLHLSTDRDTVDTPIAVTDEHGGLWVAWLQNRGGFPSVRLTHLRSEGPTEDDLLGRTIARFATVSVYPQRVPMLAPLADGSLYVFWRYDRIPDPWGHLRQAVLRFLPTSALTPNIAPELAYGFNPDGETMFDSFNGVYDHEEYFSTVGIASPSGSAMTPFSSMVYGSCHHGFCTDTAYGYQIATRGLVYGIKFGSRQGLLQAAGVARDRHSSIDLLLRTRTYLDSLFVARFQTEPLQESWTRMLGPKDATTFDDRLVQTADGGMFYARLRPSPGGLELVADAFQSDGTPKPALAPLTFYGSDQTSPLSAMVPDSHAGVVFLRSTAGTSGLDLWLGEYSGNPGLDEGLTPFAVAAGDQKDGALGNATDGAIYAAWVDARSGTQTVRVQRLVESLPTATQQVALHAVASSGVVRVRIEAGADETLRLERAVAGGAWEFLSQLDAGREGFVEYEDHPGLAASLLGYRATSRSGSSSETWIEWEPHVAFGLHRVESSGSTGAFIATLSIDPQAPAELELFDLLGRRIDRVRIAAGIGGRQTFELGAAGLRSGVMLVRLNQAGKVATMRAVVLR